MSGQKLILIIDDEDDIREMLQFKFEAEGYRVVTAENGKVGLDKLETIQPNLIILDMNMPVMGGIEFYNHICDKDFKPKYPVLVLTARANLESLFKDFAIDGFKIKPFDIEQLAQDVGAIIKKYAELEKTERPWLKEGAPVHIFIAEDDKAVFSKLAGEFLNAGYTVNTASTGTDAIERMSRDVPNFALVKLGLRDISGDLVVTRLRHMAKTSKIEFVLYVPRVAGRSRSIMEKMAEKSHIFVEYSDAEELLSAVDKAIRDARSSYRLSGA